MTITPISPIGTPSDDPPGSSSGTTLSSTSGPLQEGDPDDRMNRNAMALVASSVVTSVLGFVFWIVAARTMSTADVGTGSAVVAALVLLGNMSTLGLRNALPRFLPSLGSNTGQMIRRSYAACAVTGILVAATFIAGASVWAAELTMIRTGMLRPVVFAVAVGAWAVFVLQDSVLIGLRHATWVPVENLLYSAGKLGLLVGIASTGSWALLLAWIVPALLILGPLNFGIFTKLVPDRAVAGEEVTIEWRRIARFAGGDHFADVLRYLGAEGVVLVVLAHLGPEASAPLFFAITIAASLGLVSSNVVSAFVAEASARPDHAESLLRRAAFQTSRLVIPGALIAAGLAPIALSLFGADYVDRGTTVLRLLLLAAIPQIAMSLAIGQARFERRVSLVVKIAAGSAIGPVFGAIVLVPAFGIAAVGWSVLIGQTILAGVLLRTTLSPLFANVINWPIVETLVAVRAKLRQHRRMRAAATLFDELDATRDGRALLHPRTIIATESDVIVARVDHPEQPLIIKIALSPAATAGLFAHTSSLGALHRSTNGLVAATLLPERVESGTCVGQSYVIETACIGSPPTDVDGPTLAAAAAAMSTLHRVTARPVRPEDDLVEHLVARPIEILLNDPRLAGHREAIESLGHSLGLALHSRDLVVARTHGDYWLGNVLMDPQFDQPTVSGIVDWENSLDAGLPEIDLAHLWLSVQPVGMSLGVLRALQADRFVDLVGPCGAGAINRDLPAGLVVTLAWLAHVSAGLMRASRFPVGRMWIGHNVTTVLDDFADNGIARLADAQEGRHT